MINESFNIVFKENSARILGYLIRLVGNFDDAEDLHQEVLLIALNEWQNKAMPEQPLAWLFTIAKNKGIDFLRRTKTRHRVLEEIGLEPAADQSLIGYLDDDLLRLIFTCCHPALDPEIRVALTLKTVVGLSIGAVAHAFLVHEKTMEQRLLRVKRKIRLAGIAYEIPQPGQLGERLSSVLQTIYLMFNEGYSATSGDSLVRAPLCREAIHLSRLVRAYFPDHAELEGVIALMLLQDSRRDARLSATGQLVLLSDQDRSLWNEGQMQEGQQILDHALRLHQAPGPFQIQAAIAALHAVAPSSDETDWHEIVLLYETLIRYNASAVVRLNYLVARAMSGDVDQALAEMTSISDDLANYRPFFVARAELKLMADQQADAISDLERALALTGNSQEKAHIMRRLQQLNKRPKEI